MPHRGRCVGLTLIELLVVLAVLGLVMATVTNRLSNTLGPAALSQSVSLFRFTDQQLRGRARHTGRPVALRLELGTNQIGCQYDPAGSTAETVRTLVRGVHVVRFLSATQDLDHGAIAIPIDDRGASETFAVELARRESLQIWLLVAGVTGQITEIRDEQQAREILDTFQPPSVLTR